MEWDAKGHDEVGYKFCFHRFDLKEVQSATQSEEEDKERVGMLKPCFKFGHLNVSSINSYVLCFLFIRLLIYLFIYSVRF